MRFFASLSLTLHDLAINSDLMLDIEHYRSPGQLIEDLLTKNGWTKRVLSLIIGINETTVSKIISGKRSVDAELAIDLSDVFNVEAEVFLNLQKNYDLAQAKLLKRPDQSKANRATLYGELPITDMIKRGWIEAENVKDISSVEKSLVQFFNAENVDDIEVLPHAAKRTNVFGEVSPSQLAWLYRVKQISADFYVGRYSKEALLNSLSKLKLLMTSAEEIRKVPRILAECGVRFVIVETIPKAKIDGVCFWLNENSPVIGMSLRYDRIDNFWFVLRHEIEHILQDHGRDKLDVMLDAELEGENACTTGPIADEEKIANNAASNFCVPQDKLEKFIARKSPFFAERDIIGFSKTIKVHPGIVAGQLQHRIKKYNRFRDHLVKVRSFITPSALVDGWGDIAPVD